MKGIKMASDFDEDALDVDRHYSHNWFTLWSANFLIRRNFKLAYNLAEWLVGYANMLRSASPRDGYEWVDRRTSLFSKLHPEQQGELLKELTQSKTGEGTK